MKKKIDDIDASPSKRIYLSIISDYHTVIALCELIDNVIDNWVFEGKKGKLTISIDLDYERQIIKVVDDSGGIKREDLKMIVSPGHSRNEGNDSIIGIFGVGSKRAVIALAEDIKIYSRYKQEKTVLIEINDEWIKDASWEVPAYEVADIDPNTTRIELTRLRNQIKEEQEGSLIEHLSVTYALLLQTNAIYLKLNGKNISPVIFDSWSFPPDYEPQRISCTLNFQEKGTVEAEFLGGLIQSGDPSGGEYGVYLYCNGRLITRAYKGSEVGFRALRAGHPHPSASLARVIIKLSGPALLMPWNSSKSGVNDKHTTYQKVLSHIDQLLTHYATLSKRWSGSWETAVFQYTTGDIKNVKGIDISTRLLLPVIHKTIQRKYPEIIKKANRNLANQKPWVKGLYEAVIAVHELPKLKLEQNNRISLLILDNNLEIAFKEYLINESSAVYSEERLTNIMKNRHEVHKEIQKSIKFNKEVWKKIEYFYKLRSELMHKRATVNISDEDLANFQAVVIYALSKMFKLKFNT